MSKIGRRVKKQDKNLCNRFLQNLKNLQKKNLMESQFYSAYPVLQTVKIHDLVFLNSKSAYFSNIFYLNSARVYQFYISPLERHRF